MNQELSYCQTRAALYMSRLLKANIMNADTPPFYDYLNFSGVRLKYLPRDVTKAMPDKPDSAAKSEALDDLYQARGWTLARLIRDLNNILDDHPQESISRDSGRGYSRGDECIPRTPELPAHRGRAGQQRLREIRRCSVSGLRESLTEPDRIILFTAQGRDTST